MKENLVQQLDLLEAQLARAEEGPEELRGGRLPRTRHLLERLEKSGAPRAGAPQLRAEIARVKQELVRRKVFYAQSTVKRFVKQFNKLEPLRLAKRIKAVEAARAEEGAEPGAEDARQKKRAQLAAEAELVARADAEEWARELVLRGLAKAFDVESVLGDAFVKRPLTPAESNVFARLGKSDAVKSAVAQLVASASTHFAPRADGTGGAASGAASSAASGAANTPAGRVSGHPKAATAAATAAAAARTATGASTSGSAASAGRTATDADDFTHFASDEGDDADAAPRAAARGEADPFFTGAAVAMDVSESEDDADGLRGGLPLLAQGFISGSDDEDDAESLAAAAAAPERRNRRGQRARRKIWEQKFGRHANHVLKQEREEQRQREEKESRKRRRAEREGQARRQQQEFAAKPVHPSWQARLEQKQKQEQVRFEGKKRKFE